MIGQSSNKGKSLRLFSFVLYFTYKNIKKRYIFRFKVIQKLSSEIHRYTLTHNILFFLSNSGGWSMKNVNNCCCPPYFLPPKLMTNKQLNLSNLPHYPSLFLVKGVQSIIKFVNKETCFYESDITL